MMLLNNLFTFTNMQTDGKLIKAEIRLNAAHDIFQGHFPGKPILPGVCMMQMVKEVIETCFNNKIRLVKASDIKFLSFVDPDKVAPISIEIKVNTEPGELKVDAQLVDQETTLFKFKGVFAVA